MTLVKLEELHWGNLVLKVLRSQVNGNLFLAFDSVGKGEYIRGPFLSERDLNRIVALMRRHGHPLSPPEFTMESASYSRTSCTKYVPEGEIKEAIQNAQKANTPVKERITVLPTLPPWRYLHTCAVCGCHVQTRLCLGGTALMICASCEHVEGMHSNEIHEG